MSDQQKIIATGGHTRISYMKVDKMLYQISEHQPYKNLIDWVFV